MRRVVIVCACLLPTEVFACEPVVPFITIVGGPALLLRSAIALPIAIGLKALLFAFFQTTLARRTAAFAMVTGNIVTTIVGIIAAVMIGSVGAWTIGIVLVWLLCWLPSKRAVDIAERPWVRNLGAGGLAFAMTAALMLSCFLFVVGQGAILTNHLVTYWFIKFLAVYVALLVSILLSAFWEEWVIWRMVRNSDDETFARPVLRANLYVLLVIMIVAAAIMIPQRLKAPDFLVRILASYG